MRQYLGSEVLQAKVAEFWQLERPVGAICHGVLVLARAKDPATGCSVLSEARTTCLPKYLERSAYFMTAWKLGRYYRTYPAYVEDEVRAASEPLQTYLAKEIENLLVNEEFVEDALPGHLGHRPSDQSRLDLVLAHLEVLAGRP